MRSLIISVTLIASTVCGIIFLYREPPAGDPPVTFQAIPVLEVGALGRIEPASRVLQIHGPSTMEPPTVKTVLVAVGDRVMDGQVLAILDSHDRERADVEVAKATLQSAEKSLAQVRAGAKSGEIDAQQALVERIQERLKLTQKQLERVRRLVQTRANTEEDLDIQETEHRVLERELRQEEARLVALKEVRTVDVERAEAEVARAQAALLRAQADLATSQIRSPIAGEVLRINYRAGERIGSEGLLDLGDTSAMEVVAEVHESDILKVRPRHPATVILRNMDRELRGHVTEIGRLIGRKDVMSSDPIEDTDARVVEVRIRLVPEDGQIVSGMSYAKVEVRIQTSSDPECCVHNSTAGAMQTSSDKQPDDNSAVRDVFENLP
jgi:HlyD family secretion protein